MLYQLDKDIALVSGYLHTAPRESYDRAGERMICLNVAYDRMNHRRPQGESRSKILRLPIIVLGEYTSYARTLQKGDCVLCIGYRPIEIPKGYTVNSMLVGKNSFGFIGGTGITRAWTSEADAYTKNKVARAAKAAKKTDKQDDDIFGEIRGDWY